MRLSFFMKVLCCGIWPSWKHFLGAVSLADMMSYIVGLSFWIVSLQCSFSNLCSSLEYGDSWWKHSSVLPIDCIGWYCRTSLDVALVKHTLCRFNMSHKFCPRVRTYMASSTVFTWNYGFCVCRICGYNQMAGEYGRLIGLFHENCHLLVEQAQCWYEIEFLTSPDSAVQRSYLLSLVF